MIVALKELGDIYTGNTPSKKINEYYDSNDIYIVKPDIISDSEVSIISNSSEYISEKARDKARIAPQNSIFVTCIGTIGKIGIASDGEFAFNQQINTIKPNDSIIPKYLAYNLFYSKSRLKAISNAPVVPIINKSQFSEFTINIETDKLKQQKIVSILDKLQSIITHLRTQLEKLDLLVKARFVEMFGDVVDNDKCYPIKFLSEIAEYWNGLTYKPEDVSEEGTIVLRSSNIQNSCLDFADTVRVSCKIGDKKYVKNNDILMCSRNGSARLVGKVALIENISEPMSFGAFMMIIRSNYYYYLMTYFQMPAFRIQITTGATTTINQITGNMLNEIKLPIPDMQTVEKFADFVKQVDQSKFILQQELDKTQTLFDSLMQEYFG